MLLSIAPEPYAPEHCAPINYGENTGVSLYCLNGVDSPTLLEQIGRVQVHPRKKNVKKPCTIEHFAHIGYNKKISEIPYCSNVVDNPPLFDQSGRVHAYTRKKRTRESHSSEHSAPVDYENETSVNSKIMDNLPVPEQTEPVHVYPRKNSGTDPKGVNIVDNLGPLEHARHIRPYEKTNVTNPLHSPEHERSVHPCVKTFVTHVRPCKQTSSVSPTNVVNLSCKKHSHADLSLLNKGLSFIPSLCFNKHTVHLNKDLDTLLNNYITRHTGKIPPRSSRILNRTLASIRYDLKHVDIDNTPSNLTRAERTALKRLIGDEDLVVSKADKGDATVVMSTPQYLEMAYKHLSDRSTYKLLVHDPTRDCKTIPSISRRMC